MMTDRCSMTSPISSSLRCFQRGCLSCQASFFPIHHITDQILSALARFAPPDVLSIVHDQLLQISKNNNGGLLTLGIAGAIWSASSGMSAVINALNQAYHVQEARSWWWVRLTAIWM